MSKPSLHSNAYLGCTPKPVDFDAFWDNRKALLDQIKLEYDLHLLRSFDRFSVYELNFRSFDHALIYAKVLMPHRTEAGPCVLQFHGYPGSSRSFFELSGFVAKDLAVVAMDCRGQGGRSEDLGGIKGTTVSGHLIAGLDDRIEQQVFVKIYSDVYLMSRIAALLPGVDPDQIMVNGASQGAALGLVCSALNPRIKRTALLYPFLSDFKAVYENNADTVAYEGLRYYSRWFDPLGERLDFFFNRLGYLDTIHHAPKVSQDVLFGMSLADTVCPPYTQTAVYNNLVCPKRILRYPGKGHEPIHDFDDRAADFLAYGRQTKSSLHHRSLIQAKSGIDRILFSEQPSLVLYFNEGEAVGDFYLQRYAMQGYDVISFHSDTDWRQAKPVVEKLLKRLAYRHVIALGKANGACTAFDLARNLTSITTLVIQSPAFEHRSLSVLLKQVKSLHCSGLLAYGGLEDQTSIKRNAILKQELSPSFRVLYYPKYGCERINHFEDEIMVYLADLAKK